MSTKLVASAAFVMMVHNGCDFMIMIHYSVRAVSLYDICNLTYICAFIEYFEWKHDWNMHPPDCDKLLLVENVLE